MGIEGDGSAERVVLDCGFPDQPSVFGAHDAGSLGQAGPFQTQQQSEVKPSAEVVEVGHGNWFVSTRPDRDRAVLVHIGCRQSPVAAFDLVTVSCRVGTYGMGVGFVGVSVAGAACESIAAISNVDADT